MLLAGKLKIPANEDEHGGRGRVGGLVIDGGDAVSTIKPKGQARVRIQDGGDHFIQPFDNVREISNLNSESKLVIECNHGMINLAMIQGVIKWVQGQLLKVYLE
ncbi:Nuclear transport factor 2 [Senna tora]|uniref:Nuclear transport factor 2 n=1 Tax=Senna tora TaxID=362788 RepID=A0A834W3K5_9FABA|nr:Nuclear transport factor 2 [Senna tora]